MVQQNAARIYKNMQQAYANQERQKALNNPQTFVQLAKARGYNFTVEELETQLSQLSDEEVAAIFNPGLGPRKHIFPR